MREQFAHQHLIEDSWKIGSFERHCHIWDILSIRLPLTHSKHKNLHPETQSAHSVALSVEEKVAQLRAMRHSALRKVFDLIVRWNTHI